MTDFLPISTAHGLRRLGLTTLALLLAGLLSACASLPVDDAERLSREGRYEEALALLDAALEEALTPEAKNELSHC